VWQAMARELSAAPCWLARSRTGLLQRMCIGPPGAGRRGPPAEWHGLKNQERTCVLFYYTTESGCTCIFMVKSMRIGEILMFWQNRSSEWMKIAPAVWNEVVEQRGRRAGAREVFETSQTGWINVWDNARARHLSDQQDQSSLVRRMIRSA